MTDELTPEEKEALKKLPREQVPSAGLEERVVGALRERGVLAKRRRRTIEITNSRVAGLLAACVALVIGGYSIGLHRGGGDQMLSGVTTVVPRADDRGAVETPATGTPETPVTGAPEAKTGRIASDERHRAEPLAAATDAEKRDLGAPKKESPAEPSPALVADSEKQTVVERSRSLEERDEEPARSLEEREEEPAERPPKVPASQPQEAQPSQDMMKESVRMAQPQPEGVATLAQPKATGEPPLVFERTLSFLLDGTPVVVDAPDSVRIAQDDLGQMIIIYTKDGPIRFRLKESVRVAQPEGEFSTAQPKATGEPPLVFARTLPFLLDGTPVVVDAPDSVRITQDDLGRMIIIYPKDGPIRFRLADDD